MHRIFGGSNDFLKVFPKNRFFENFTVDSSLKKHDIREKNDFAKISKNLDTNLKIILLSHQNNYVEYC